MISSSFGAFRAAVACAVLVVCGAVPDVRAAQTTPSAIQNPAIDMEGYLSVAREAADWRESHRLTEAEFLRQSRLPDTIVLDARSAEKYGELHVRDAVNLSFPDMTVESLARLLPDKSQRILIYCNNNFSQAEGPFPSKLKIASLNLSTYIALYSYGYRNIYELGPQIDLAASILEFDSAPDAKHRE
ncbi:MAG: rhodanese-like domain-containing protein [Rhodanobacteraceae bacterium]